MSPFVRRDLLTASLAAIFSFVMLYVGWALPLGSAFRMGPGYVPRIIGFSLLAVALAITVRAAFNWRRGHHGIANPMPVNWKALLAIAAGAIAFAVLIQQYGLITSAVAAVILTSLAQAANGLGERLLLAGGLAAFSSLVFVVALELPLPILPTFF